MVLCLLYQGAQPGGQLTTTTEVENYPGYPEGVLGTQMMLDFQKQAERFGTVVKTAMITAVDFATYPFQLTVDHQDRNFFPKALLLLQALRLSG